MDRELLWIFGGMKLAEHPRGPIHSIEDHNLDSEAESCASFSSIMTQASDPACPAQKKRKSKAALQLLPSEDDADDELLTDCTADSEADGLDSKLLEGDETNDASRPSCCNNRVHHEVATGVT